VFFPERYIHESWRAEMMQTPVWQMLSGAERTEGRLAAFVPTVPACIAGRPFALDDAGTRASACCRGRRSRPVRAAHRTGAESRRAFGKVNRRQAGGAHQGASWAPRPHEFALRRAPLITTQPIRWRRTSPPRRRSASSSSGRESTISAWRLRASLRSARALQAQAARRFTHPVRRTDRRDLAGSGVAGGAQGCAGGRAAMERFTRIKSGELGLSPSRIIKADDFSTAHDARAILDEARAEAARIVTEAKEVTSASASAASRRAAKRPSSRWPSG
jgi:hypothetical protein